MSNRINTWPELRSAVETNEGIAKIPMEKLRELEGRQRVGKHILSAIEDRLATMGLGHLPEELPNRQQQYVLLYSFGTPASEVIESVRKGLTEPASDTTYEYLHRLNSVPDPDSVVSREEFSEAIETTARSVLDLLGQVRPEEDSAPVTPSKRTARKKTAVPAKVRVKM